MKIKNVTDGNIIIGDLLNSNNSHGLSLPSQVEALIFNEDAEKSRELGTFLTSGAILNLGSDEPSTGEPQSGTQPSIVGSFQVSVSNAPAIGKTVVATSETTAEWQAISGLIIFIDSEHPAGIVDGINKIFTLANVPAPNSLHLYNNGLRQALTVDYTIVSQTITFTEAPTKLLGVVADYRL